MKSDLIEIETGVYAETEKAILVGDSGDPNEGVWLPKSQIEYREVGKQIIEITMPEWLALQKGLI